MGSMKEVISSNLNQRDTESLKNDVKVACDSTDDGSGIVFVLGLNILEERLSKKEYEEFEDTL